MLYKVTLNQTQPDLSKKILILDDEGGFQSISLQEPSSATVLINKDGLRPIYKPQILVDQEYEKDPYTKTENSLYKQLLYKSRLALLVVNKLKNSRLINKDQFIEFLKPYMPKHIRKCFSDNKFINLLFEDRIKQVKKLEHDIEATSFNRLPLNYLGISKTDVMNAFKTEGLI